jgi:hypothetical protein
MILWKYAVIKKIGFEKLKVLCKHLKESEVLSEPRSEEISQKQQESQKQEKSIRSILSVLSDATPK